MGNPPLDRNAAAGRLAFYMSAFVMPGAGHFVQKRWGRGACYVVGFTVCAVILAVKIFMPIFVNLARAMEFASTGRGEQFMPIGVGGILTWTALTLLVYAAALADVYIWHRRRAGRALQGPEPEAPPGNGRETQ